jgi:UDP-N-acetylglucosamine diphosphorylase / glucose-1-phosphate thymidylyltransferase / UDP-N-acetylgalactosamine diphosphorylase / glucosamine-1-phosphate N-acetyltransferase / galactosamine-1-phosphate N-acetyltransferase
MIKIEDFARNFPVSFPDQKHTSPWNLVKDLQTVLAGMMSNLADDFVIRNNIAIHRTARIEDHVILKGPAIIEDGCFIGAHAYLRGGVFLGSRVSVGPGCEIKSSVILSGSALAHFNFVGDSVIGSDVNMEAGSVIANHFNERKDKTIFILLNGSRHAIDSNKFGAVVGDRCRIGANAVLSPGTVLHPESVVKRLELVEQCAPKH